VNLIVLASKNPDVWRRARLRYVYRIYTEAVNLPKIERVLKSYFPGYTIFQGRGSWKGKSENSLVIEIEGARSTDVRRAASKIKAVNRQESVLVSRVKGASILCCGIRQIVEAVEAQADRKPPFRPNHFQM